MSCFQVCICIIIGPDNYKCKSKNFFNNGALEVINAFGMFYHVTSPKVTLKAYSWNSLIINCLKWGLMVYPKLRSKYYKEAENYLHSSIYLSHLSFRLLLLFYLWVFEEFIEVTLWYWGPPYTTGREVV